MKSLKDIGIASYYGVLDANAAASSVQAAKLNALELIGSADVLFETKHYSHATALAILAIEELGKPSIILTLFLGGGKTENLWQHYRQHTSKTALLNFSISTLAAKHFPYLPKNILKKAKEGPTPSELDAQKQLALYSDVFIENSSIVCHLPSNIDWQIEAHARICESKALAHNLRDYPPEELEVWHRHLYPMAQKNPAEVSLAYKGLARELEERGFIKKEAWKNILSALENPEAIKI